MFLPQREAQIFSDFLIFQFFNFSIFLLNQFKLFSLRVLFRNVESRQGFFGGVLAKTQLVQNAKTEFEIKTLKLNLKTKKFLHFANVMPVAKY